MSQNEVKRPDKPEDRLAIHVNGELKEIFMSGGLLRRLAPYVGHADDFSQIYQDAITQNMMVVEALRPRTVYGTAVAKRGDGQKVEHDIDDFELSTDDMDKLVNWITEHVLYFFISGVLNAKTLAEKNKEVMTSLQKLMQLSNGSEDSQEPKQ